MVIHARGEFFKALKNSGLYVDVDKICIVVAFLSYLTLVKFGMICVTLLSCTILSVFFFFIYGDIYGWFDSSLLRV